MPHPACPPETIGRLELEIMQIVWAADPELPLSIRAIQRALSARRPAWPRADAAIEIAVSRLADSDKGLLLELELPVRGRGVVAHFVAAVDRATFLAQAVQPPAGAPGMIAVEHLRTPSLPI